MLNGRGFKTAAVAAFVTLVSMASEAHAAPCGTTAAGFDAWKSAFADEARAKGIGEAGVAGLMATHYSRRPSGLTDEELSSVAFGRSWPSAAARSSRRAAARSSNRMRRSLPRSSSAMASRPDR